MKILKIKKFKMNFKLIALVLIQVFLTMDFLPCRQAGTWADIDSNNSTLAPIININHSQFQQIYYSSYAQGNCFLGGEYEQLAKELINKLRKEWSDYNAYQLVEFIKLYQINEPSILRQLARYDIGVFFLDKKIKDEQEKIKIIEKAIAILKEELLAAKIIPPGIKALLFDLDGTLYINDELGKLFHEVRMSLIAERLSLTKEEAEKHYYKTKEELSKEKFRQATHTEVINSLGITVDEWEEYNSTRIHPEKYLREDKNLKLVLEKLSKQYLLVIVTNNSDIQTQRILKTLGIKDYFQRIFTRTTLRRTKPDPEAFRIVLRRLGLKPEECLSIGDREEVDILIPQALGMSAMLVSSLDDIYNLKRGEEISSNDHLNNEISNKPWWDMIEDMDKAVLDISDDLSGLLFDIIPYSIIIENQSRWFRLIKDSLKEKRIPIELSMNLSEIKEKVKERLIAYYPERIYSFEERYLDLVWEFVLAQIKANMIAQPLHKSYAMSEIYEKVKDLAAETELRGKHFHDELLIKNAILNWQFASVIAIRYETCTLQDAKTIRQKMKGLESLLKKIKRQGVERILIRDIVKREETMIAQAEQLIEQAI